MLLSELCFNQPFYVVGGRTKLFAVSLDSKGVLCKTSMGNSTITLSGSTAIKPALDR